MNLGIRICLFCIPFWLVAGLEFYASHRSKAHGRRFDITYYAVVLPFYLLVIVPFYAIFRSGYDPGLVTKLLFYGTFFIGLIIRFLGHKKIGRLFSPKVELQEGHLVVNTGIYKHIRHPLYLGTIFMALGTLLFYVNALTILFFLLTIAGHIWRIATEEKYLRENLKGYEEYTRMTKRLIPGIF